MTKAKFDPSKVKVVKAVTLPVLSKVDNQPIFITITSAITAKDTTDDKGEPATIDICNVTNLETGEAMQMVVNTVLKSSLVEEYPKDEYVNKSFKVTQLKVEGKRYKKYSMFEIEA